MDFCKFEGKQLECFPEELYRQCRAFKHKKRSSKKMRDINVHLNFNKLSAAEFNHHLIPFNLTLEAQRLKVSNLLLSDNCLSTLPWTLQSFRYLDTLYLHRNHLDSLPIWFAPALGHCLRVLTLAENPLRSLPDNLYLLTLLEELYLRDTHLRALPCTLCMLDRLKILDFEAGHLTAPQLAFNSGGHESLAARCLQALLHHHCEIAAIPSEASLPERWELERRVACFILSKHGHVLFSDQHRFLRVVASLPAFATFSSRMAQHCDDGWHCPPRCSACQQLFPQSGFRGVCEVSLAGSECLVVVHTCSQSCLSRMVSNP